ncbi:hypothetical protein HKBW3S47_01563 [Candidatus Hakubella thermalkaliphila]|uniref:Uncharacterized protein n=1 Tax=Candidatus Hakubella thermalkaliphila TaxID=2754717 RepID=A0A6V8Q8W6_9ACTN|nr:hypothetical protein HKBW3S47_01563 [Candidatus Hakubella thermalkaliphila]
MQLIQGEGRLATVNSIGSQRKAVYIKATRPKVGILALAEDEEVGQMPNRSIGVTHRNFDLDAGSCMRFLERRGGD